MNLYKTKVTNTKFINLTKNIMNNNKIICENRNNIN